MHKFIKVIKNELRKHQEDYIPVLPATKSINFFAAVSDQFFHVKKTVAPRISSWLSAAVVCSYFHMTVTLPFVAFCSYRFMRVFFRTTVTLLFVAF